MRKKIAAIALGALMAAAALIAQNSPAIGGYCPVAYAAMGKAVKGDPAHSSDYHGQHFLFSNADAKKMFDKGPKKFAPAYSGYCAAAVAKGMKVKSDPTLFTVHDGRTYLFSTEEAKGMFDASKDKMISMADKQWPAVAKKPETSM